MVALKFKPLKKAADFGAKTLTLGVLAEAIALYTIDSIWIYEICTVIILFALGTIFTTSNTLAMNEGRQQAGEASSLLGISGYIVGAIVSPMVGIGNVLHSTAIVYAIVTIAVIVCARLSSMIAPDLTK